MKELKPHLITFVIVVAGVLTATYVQGMIGTKGATESTPAE